MQFFLDGSLFFITMGKETSYPLRTTLQTRRYDRRISTILQIQYPRNIENPKDTIQGYKGNGSVKDSHRARVATVVVF